MSEYLTSGEVCERLGITYRQLDYWTTKGYVRPSVERATGPGSLRRWSHSDLEQVRHVRNAMSAPRELVHAP